MYQKIVKNIIYPLSDKFLGLSIDKNLKKNRTIQWFSNKKELRSIQNKKLYAILSHCKKNIPYYKTILNDSNFDWEGDLFQELKKDSHFNKKLIRKNLPNNLIDKKRNIYTIEKTSGSSGEQGEFYLDREAFSKIIAAQTLYWEWAGYSFGKKAIQTGINPERGLKKHLKDKLLLIKYADAFRIDSKMVEKNLSSFRNKRKYFSLDTLHQFLAMLNLLKN